MLEALVGAARQAVADDDTIAASLTLASEVGGSLPLPGSGDTATRWNALAAVAEVDLTVARVLEPHVDALAILAEAGLVAGDGAYGVFAAEAPGVTLEARPDGARWCLTGRKPWCSLAGRVDRALITAHVPEGRQLFDVDLRQRGVEVEPTAWVARGLREVISGPVTMADVIAEPVGAPGWYLTRPGFAWGGIGVAACWLGGVRPLLTALREALRGREDLIRQANLGQADVAHYAADRCLRDSAAAIDGQRSGREARLLAARVRTVVAQAVETVIMQVGHALGPAPLAFDEDYARRVADLQLYVRQHHAERDLAALGRDLVEPP